MSLRCFRIRRLEAELELDDDDSFVLVRTFVLEALSSGFALAPSYLTF